MILSILFGILILNVILHVSFLYFKPTSKIIKQQQPATLLLFFGYILFSEFMLAQGMKHFKRVLNKKRGQ